MTSEKKNSIKKTNTLHLKSISDQKFLEYLSNAPDKKCDLIDGKYFHHSPASKKHVLLRQFITQIINNYVIEKDLGIILTENFPLKLDEKNWREPDLMYINKTQLQLVKPRDLQGLRKDRLSLSSPSLLSGWLP